MSPSEVQAAFRHSPSRATALAYMDAATYEWETDAWDAGPDTHREFVMRMQEIRDWLMNERAP